MNKKILAAIFIITSFVWTGLFFWNQRKTVNEVSTLISESQSSYTACGCGCCGGSEPLQECLYRSKGDDLDEVIDKIKAEDEKLEANPENCRLAGCSRGTTYKYCD